MKDIFYFSSFITLYFLNYTFFNMKLERLKDILLLFQGVRWHASTSSSQRGLVLSTVSF